MLRKILILVILVLGIGINGYAKRFNADINAVTATENAQWDSSLRSFSWTANEAYIDIPVTLTDVSSCSRLVVEVSEVNNGPFTIELVKEDGTLLDGITNYYYAPSTKTIDLTAFEGHSQMIKAVRFVSQSNEGNIKTGDIYLVQPLKLNFDESGKAYLYPQDFIDGVSGLAMTEDGVVSKDNAGEAKITIDFGEAVDLSGVASIVTDVNMSSEEGYTDLVLSTTILNANNIAVNSWYTSKYNIVYNDEYRTKSSNVQTISYNFDSAKTGKMKINSICFTAGFITAVKGDEICLNDLPFYVKNAEGKFNETTNPTWNINMLAAEVYGSCVNVQNCDAYTDVSAYESIRLYATQGGDHLRFWFFNSDNSNIETFYAQKVENKDYMLVDISAVKEKCGGKAYLIGAKTDNGPSAYVTNIAVVRYGVKSDYNISGFGLLTNSVQNALSDVSATCIDVTGLTNAIPLNLVSVNPNCLFIASNASTLSNTENVVVKGENGNVCERLYLDTAYPFSVPYDFTAQTASASKTVSDAGFATFVLPYTCVVPEKVKAYAIHSVKGSDLECTLLDQINANEPVLLSEKGEYSFVAENVDIKSAEVPQNGKLVGSYIATTAPKGSYVLQKQNDVVAFYKVAEDKTQQVVPFSAYLVLDEADANRLTISLDQTTSLTNSNADGVVTIEAVYDLTGTQRNAMQRGINIVKLSDGSVRKIIVK